MKPSSKKASHDYKDQKFYRYAYADYCQRFHLRPALSAKRSGTSLNQLLFKNKGVLPPVVQ